MNDLRYTARYNLSEVGSDAFAFAECLPGGLTVKRRLPAEKRRPHDTGSRGVINGLSANSKRRLTKRLMRVPWGSFTGPKNADVVQGLFNTLTYPAEYSTAWQDWKHHLDMFIRRLKRRWPILCVVWKLEFQQRGAPHFHLVELFKRPVIVSEFRAWVSQAWYEVVGSGDPDHLKAGTEAHGLYIPGDGGGSARLMQYLCKYISKMIATLDIDETGRVWGVRGDVPTMSYGAVKMNRFQYEAFLNFVRQHNPMSKYLSVMTALQNGFNVFGDGAELIYWFDCVGAYVESEV